MPLSSVSCCEEGQSSGKQLVGMGGKRTAFKDGRLPIGGDGRADRETLQEPRPTVVVVGRASGRRRGASFPRMEGRSRCTGRCGSLFGEWGGEEGVSLWWLLLKTDETRSSGGREGVRGQRTKHAIVLLPRRVASSQHRGM